VPQVFFASENSAILPANEYQSLDKKEIEILLQKKEI